MIVKKVKSPKTTKPKHWQIFDLVDYIRFPHNRDPQEKIEHAGGRNFFSATHSGQKLEMVSLAQEAVRSNMPVSHWVFSWQEQEQPTRQNVEELVDVFLEQMGLVGHQVIYGLHHNTENYHLHIAVNRMNENTGKVVLPHNGFDIEAAHRIVAIVENRQKWKPEPHARYEVLENGEVARKRYAKTTAKITTKACHFEHRTGEKSAETIGKEKALPIIVNSKSWQELHEGLAKIGLQFEKKGSGAIVKIGETVVKASTIDRSISLSKLCKRLGEYVPGQYGEMPALPPEPVEAVVEQNLEEEWQEYQREKAISDTPPPQTEATEQARELDKLRAQQRQSRQQKLSRLKKYGLNILNIARHCLKVQQRQERQNLRQKLRTASRKRFPSFENWLRKTGKLKSALRWRSRKKSTVLPALPGQEADMPKTPNANLPELDQFREYAAAVGADRYRVTSIRMFQNGDKQVFILDKKNGQTLGFSQEEMASHMPEMLRLQQRGENLYYTPLSKEKHHILIDDMTAESLNRLQQDGFRPAAILESSPGNYQCILTIPKLKTEFDRDVGNRITERLNKEYGDPKLSGCIHPHRAPGFSNRKPKHRRQDGTYPQVKLLFTECRQCQKAFEMTWAISKEYAEAAKKRVAKKPQIFHGTSRPGDPIAAYHAHFDNIRANLAIEDYSRVDAMIAVRMRANGHSQQEVEAAIKTCAPGIREDKVGRNWQRYAERTARYAFGPAGDNVMARNEKYLEHWRNIEKAQAEAGIGVRQKM